jgi:polyhydroxyalkanoate synthesis regulator phasin
MPDEPENLVLHLLREIRTKQDSQGTTLEQMHKRLEDLYTMSTHTLGVAARAHERYEAPEARVDQLSERLNRIETKQ